MFPKLFWTGSFYIPTYGVFVALAFLSALWITVRFAKRAGYSPEVISNLAVYCALAGMLGAKLFMFLFNWRDYWTHPGDIFSLSTLQSAGVYQGGLLLALVTAYYYMRRHNLPLLETADLFAPGLALGHAIGRLGCFSAGCCWGTECHLPWAVTFRNPEANKLTGVPLYEPLHPTQLYESAAEFLIFAWLFRRIQRAHAPGALIGWYLVLYSMVRFLVEFVRNHEQPLQLGLSLTQWISLATLAAGLWLLLRSRRAGPVLAASR